MAIEPLHCSQDVTLIAKHGRTFAMYLNYGKYHKHTLKDLDTTFTSGHENWVSFALQEIRYMISLGSSLRLCQTHSCRVSTKMKKNAKLSSRRGTSSQYTSNGNACDIKHFQFSHFKWFYMYVIDSPVSLLVWGLSARLDWHTLQ